MNNDNVIAFQPSETATPFSDALTELVRQGGRQIIAQAVEAELKEFLAQYQSLKNDQGRQAIVRNGYLPERTITTGVGEVEIQVPKVRDRSGSGIKFNSSLLPVQIKKTIQPLTRMLLNSSSYTRFDNNSSVNVRWQDVAMPAQLLARRGWHTNRWLPTFLVISGPLGRFLKEQDSPLKAILRNDYAKYPTLAQARDVFNHDIFRRLRNGVGHWSFLWQENNGVQQLVMVDWETGVTDITITLLEAEAFHLVAFSGSIGSAMLM